MNLSIEKLIFNEFFLHFYVMDGKMDLFSFLRRKNMTQADLSRALDTTPGNVNRWAKGDGVPGYDLCEKLLKLGMTVEELFGIDYSDRSGAPVTVPPDIMNDPAFREGLQESIKAKIDAVVSEQVTAILKAKGLI